MNYQPTYRCILGETMQLCFPVWTRIAESEIQNSEQSKWKAMLTAVTPLGKTATAEDFGGGDATPPIMVDDRWYYNFASIWFKSKGVWFLEGHVWNGQGMVNTFTTSVEVVLFLPALEE